MLLVIALFGLFAPGGILVYWFVTRYNGPADIYGDKFALGFIFDLLLVVILLAFWFAKHPIGKIKWYWFVVLSLGGVSFSLPFYYWLNKRGA